MGPILSSKSSSTDACIQWTLGITERLNEKKANMTIDFSNMTLSTWIWIIASVVILFILLRFFLHIVLRILHFMLRFFWHGLSVIILLLILYFILHALNVI